MSWASTVPTAITGLVEALRAVPDLAGIVHDGPEMSNGSATEYIAVGFLGANAEDDTAVEGNLAIEGMATSPNRETYTVRCSAQAVDGGTDITAARGRVYDLLAQVGAGLAADTTLGGAVMQASIGDVSLAQTQDSRGAVATLAFGVDCAAYTVR